MSTWKDKKILITGHTGFKGAWLTAIFSHLGAKVSGLALEPATTPNLFSLLKLQSEMENHIVADIREQ